MRNSILPFLSFAICILFFASCKKETFINSPDARFSLSADTIKFDTVFTTAGSVTQVFKINNNNNQKLKISSIRLMGGTASAFKININGVPGPEQTDITLSANDSMYVFVSVLINPSAANQPFVIEDSIRIEYNSNTRWVQLQAYGQDANFLSNTTINSSSTWADAKPYVILGGLRIASSATLTIAPGTKIYMHADAPLLVDGTLLANGTASSHIIFTGDRLDEPYRNFPASWPGIYFRDSSKDNQLSFSEIHNAYQAIVVNNPSLNANPKLVLKQCIINNAYSTGILCSNTSLVAENCLVVNSGSNIFIQLGGTYNFTHCTVASYSSPYIFHKDPVLSISDAALVNGNLVTAPLNAVFRNSIFWGDNGSVNDEIKAQKEGASFTALFDHCLYKAVNTIPYSTFISDIKNQDPAFDSIDVANKYFDFRITKNALFPSIDKGVATSLIIDLDANNRNVGLPDLGCYEKQ